MRLKYEKTANASSLKTLNDVGAGGGGGCCVNLFTATADHIVKA